MDCGGNAHNRVWCCIRCQAVLNAAADDRSTVPAAGPPASLLGSCHESLDVESWINRAPGLGYDDWLLDEQLRHAKRLTAGARPKGELAAVPECLNVPDQPGRAADAAAPLAIGSRQPVRNRRRQRPRSAMLAWLILFPGLAAFTCGLVLSGWALVAGRSDLGTIGPPIALAGQMALLFGLVLQLDIAWRGRPPKRKTNTDQAMASGNHSPRRRGRARAARA